MKLIVVLIVIILNLTSCICSKQCKPLYNVKTRTLDIKGLTATLKKQQIAGGIGEINNKIEYAPASEELQKLDLIQYGLCNDICLIKHNRKLKNEKIAEIIDVKKKMLEIAKNPEFNLSQQALFDSIKTLLSNSLLNSKDIGINDSKQIVKLLNELNTTVSTLSANNHDWKKEKDSISKNIQELYLLIEIYQLDYEILNNKSLTIEERQKKSEKINNNMNNIFHSVRDCKIAKLTLAFVSPQLNNSIYIIDEATKKYITDIEKKCPQ